jgi:hypothetical protein
MAMATTLVDYENYLVEKKITAKEKTDWQFIKK